MKILGITAIVSVSLASLLCVGLFAGMQAPHQQTTSITVNSGGWDSINANLETNDRWIVQYTADTSNLEVFLLTSSQYYDFQYYGYVYGFLDSRSGSSSGQFDHTASYYDTYYIVFLNGNYYSTTIQLIIESR